MNTYQVKLADGSEFTVDADAYEAPNITIVGFYNLVAGEKVWFASYTNWLVVKKL